MKRVIVCITAALLIVLTAIPTVYARQQSDTINPKKKMVALTFDDGPNGNTKRVLSVLKKYNARATFFVQGQYIKKNKGAIRKMDAMGCEIGCHTWNHKSLLAMSGGQLKGQIKRTDRALMSVIGKKTTLLRPPYGSHSKSKDRLVGKPLILWTVDTLDWKTRNAAKTFSAVRKGARDGAIILMHDIHAPTGAAVERIVPWLINHGYQLVTVSELAAYRSTKLKAGHAYRIIKGKRVDIRQKNKPEPALSNVKKSAAG